MIDFKGFASFLVILSCGIENLQEYLSYYNTMTNRQMTFRSNDNGSRVT